MSEEDKIKAAMDEALENLEAATQEYEKQTKAMVDKLLSLGISQSVINDWICLRTHTEHPWGLCAVKLDGKTVGGIVCPSNDDPLKGYLCFVEVTKEMKITDMLDLPPSGDLFEVHVANPTTKKNMH